MATDGVKIIDGDTAHDTYWRIMDLYDGGATPETIRAQIPFPQDDIYDDFDYEIYTTAYAIAMWEIGYITNDIIEEVRKVIDKGVCVRTWTEEYAPKLGRQRQKELDKLWGKITSENIKIRKRKKHKLISKFIFDINDVLAFQLPDNLYYATILLEVTQYRGRCTYQFGKLLYQSPQPPTIEDIKKCNIIGRKIPCGYGMDITPILSMNLESMLQQGGVDELLKKEAEKNGSYKIGMSMTGINHKNLINIADKFTKVGNLNLPETCKNMGSLGGATTFENLTSEFKDLDDHMKVFGETAFAIEELLKA